MPKVVESAVPVSSRTGWETLYSLVTLNKEGTLIGLWLFLVQQLQGIFGCLLMYEALGFISSTEENKSPPVGSCLKPRSRWLRQGN